MGCSCGFEVLEGEKGCGKVIDELVYRDEQGDITDTEWVHCGEKDMLCDDCKGKYTNEVKSE